MRANSTQYEELSSVIKRPIKFIHIIRNPFDNIATMTLRAGYPGLRKKAQKENLQVFYSDCVLCMGPAKGEVAMAPTFVPLKSLEADSLYLLQLYYL